MKKIEILDYIFLGQLLLSLLFFFFLKFTSYSNYKSFILTISFIAFFCYWLIRIIFNKEYKLIISGG
jgi:hypothetical protein